VLGHGEVDALQYLALVERLVDALEDQAKGSVH
jgi:hypothetical protein